MAPSNGLGTHWRFIRKVGNRNAEDETATSETECRSWSETKEGFIVFEVERIIDAATEEEVR
jgi:hypothetical protein